VNFTQLSQRLVPLGKKLSESLIIALFEGFVQMLQLLDVASKNGTDQGLVGHQDIAPDGK